jgi:hypothetical protein
MSCLLITSSILRLRFTDILRLLKHIVKTSSQLVCTQHVTILHLIKAMPRIFKTVHNTSFYAHKFKLPLRYVFWVITQCGLLVIYQRFGETFCLHLQSQVSTYTSTRQGGQHRHVHLTSYHLVLQSLYPPYTYKFLLHPWVLIRHNCLRLHGTSQNRTCLTL